MNWDPVGAIAEVCGALAVLVTLIYLAVQIRQQNQVARAQVHQQRADSVIQLASYLYSEENRGLFTKISQIAISSLPIIRKLSSFRRV